jgi:hypothetical protein
MNFKEIALKLYNQFTAAPYPLDSQSVWLSVDASKRYHSEVANHNIKNEYRVSQHLKLTLDRYLVPYYTVNSKAKETIHEELRS